MNGKKTFSLSTIAEITHSRLIGNPHHIISGIDDLESATIEDVSFYSNPRYEKALLASQAGAIFISESTPQLDGKNYLIHSDPSKAFQQIIELFHTIRPYPSAFTKIHPTAVLHESAKIDETVCICPYAVIDANVVIEKNTFIGAGVYIGPGTKIGFDCIIHPHVTIREECEIGDRVIIQPGAVIGACGFGYITDTYGKHQKLNQVGNVKIEDDVEIGANASIDRSRFKSTLIGQGSKIDNLVQLGHGVKIGLHNIIVAQTGIAGSTITGKYVVIGGQVGIAGHLKIADMISIAGKSGVTKSLKTKGKYGGNPAIDLEHNNRIQVHTRKIGTYVERIKNLEEELLDLKTRLQ